VKILDIVVIHNYSADSVEAPKRENPSPLPPKEIPTQPSHAIEVTCARDGGFRKTQEALMAKIDWATQELTLTQSVEYSTQLCLLIGEAVTALRKLT